MLWTSGSAHSKFLFLSFFFLRLTQELLLSQSLFPPLRLPHPGHNAQSPLQPLRNTIDYMVFTPLRAGGQGSPRALKPKSQAHCPAKGEKAGGKAQPTFRGLIPARKKRRSSSALAEAEALRNRTAQAAHPEKLTERGTKRHINSRLRHPAPERFFVYTSRYFVIFTFRGGLRRLTPKKAERLSVCVKRRSRVNVPVTECLSHLFTPLPLLSLTEGSGYTFCARLPVLSGS